MELTREYFDQGLANLVEKMATKDDLATGLASLEQRLVDYIEEVGQIIIEAVAFNFDKAEKRLDKIETAIRPIDTDAYQVKEALPGMQTERLPNLHELVVAAMAKRGRKWPSNPSGQKAE